MKQRFPTQIFRVSRHAPSPIALSPNKSLFLASSHTCFATFLSNSQLPSASCLLLCSRYRIPAARFNEVLQFPDVARPTNAAPARISGEVRHLRRHARMYRGRLARVVDHMVDRPVFAQRYRDHVVELYRGALIA